MSNLGHRLGEKVFKGPENTLERLDANFAYQGFPDFKYWEFDIQESKDGHIFVFHDRKVKNFGTLRDFTMKEIQERMPWVPRFDEVLNKLDLLHSKYPEIAMKPIRVEIKLLVSDLGRQVALGTLVRHRRRNLKYEGTHYINFIAFPSHFKKSFPIKRAKKPWWKFWVRGEVLDNVQLRWGLKFRENDCHVLSVKKKSGGMHVYDMFSKRAVL